MCPGQIGYIKERGHCVVPIADMWLIRSWPQNWPSKQNDKLSVPVLTIYCYAFYVILTPTQPDIQTDEMQYVMHNNCTLQLQCCKLPISGGMSLSAVTLNNASDHLDNWHTNSKTRFRVSTDTLTLTGLTENDGHENDGPSKLQDMKMTAQKWRQGAKLQENKQSFNRDRPNITMKCANF